MHTIEFQKWLRDLGQKFPAIRAWYAEINPIADRDALLNSWEAAMCNLDFEDCLAANMAMLSGELDGPGNTEAYWQSLPARIRRHAFTIKLSRAGACPQTLQDRLEQERNLFILDRRKSGRTNLEIDAELRATGLEGLGLSNSKQPEPQP